MRVTVFFGFAGLTLWNYKQFYCFLWKSEEYILSTDKVRTRYVPQIQPVQRPCFARIRPYKCVLKYVLFPYSAVLVVLVDLDRSGGHLWAK